MLKMKAKDLGQVIVLSLSGRIDLGDGEVALNKAVRGLMTEGRKRIVLNMKGVDLIDSAGLGVLAGLSVSSKRQEAVIRLAELRPFVDGVLVTTGLNLKFDVFPTEAEAISSFITQG